MELWCHVIALSCMHLCDQVCKFLSKDADTCGCASACQSKRWRERHREGAVRGGTKNNLRRIPSTLNRPANQRTMHHHSAWSRAYRKRMTAYLELCTRSTCHLVCNLFEIDATHEVHLARVNLQDVKPGRLVGVWELNLTVDAPRPQQRRIEDVNSVGSHENLDDRAGSHGPGGRAQVCNKRLHRSAFDNQFVKHADCTGSCHLPSTLPWTLRLISSPCQASQATYATLLLIAVLCLAPHRLCHVSFRIVSNVKTRSPLPVPMMFSHRLAMLPFLAPDHNLQSLHTQCTPRHWHLHAQGHALAWLSACNPPYTPKP